MGGLNAFDLVVVGSGIYFSGQPVNGQVIIDTSEELTNIKSVKVKIKGKGEVHWTERVTLDSVFIFRYRIHISIIYMS